MQLKRLTLSLMLISGSLIPLIIKADVLPYTPRLTVIGTGGNNAAAQAEALIPLLGDNMQLWYGDLQSRYGDSKSWSGSLGTGYRRIINNAIWGGYLFADRNRTELGHNLWSLSLGLERLSETWDFRINGYLPVNNKQWQGEWQAANQLGIRDYIHFAGHTLSDRLAAYTDETAKGVDAEVGYHVNTLPGLTLTGGVYHYRYRETGNFTGVGARAEYPVTRYVGLVLSDSYDKEQHNQVAVGIKLNFGGAVTDPHQVTLSQRLTDEVKRGIGILGSGSLIPTQTSLLISDRTTLLSDNVWFFKSGAGANATVADGTYEHPFSGLEQAYVDKAGQQALLYVSSGDYGWPAQINLQSGQTLQGRTIDFLLPANGEQRPLFYGQMAVIAQDSVTIDSVRFSDNTNTANPTIGILNTNNVLINNVSVSRYVADNHAVIVNGIGVKLSNGVKINKSDIDISTAGLEEAEGIGIINNESNLTIDDSNIKVNADAAKSALSLGIHIMGVDNNLTVNNSKIEVEANSAKTASAYGVGAIYSGLSSAPSKFTVNNSNITVSANAEEFAEANGIAGITESQSVDLQVATSSINVKADSFARAIARGIFYNDTLGVNTTSNRSSLSVENSTINSSVNGGFSHRAYGIYTSIYGQVFDVSIKNNKILAATSSAQQEQEEGNAFAAGVSLNGRIVNGTISGNTIAAEAESFKNNAIAVAVEAKSEGSLSNSDVSSKLKVETNTLSAKASSTLAEAYSAGIYLVDVTGIITGNKINSHADGKFADTSKAYGIATNIEPEIIADNSFDIGGFAMHKDITNDISRPYLLSINTFTVKGIATKPNKKR